MKIFRKHRLDLLAIGCLIGLWMLFYWRLLTPIPEDQASLKLGDFSGQFVTFATYQYDRFTEGEIPLWNPYNNGGLPFIADTQSAVFYPPRLLTILGAKLAGGWTYHALEVEMMAHVLAYSIMLFILLRVVTTDIHAQPTVSILSSVFGTIAGTYGGFLQGYPPLQLALLEAAIWLPFSILGLHLATRTSIIRYGWLLLSGFSLGLSWMAGHPQTSYFLTLLVCAYWVFRVWRSPNRLKTTFLGIGLVGIITFGLVAVQLLPGLEYLILTSRSTFGYDAKGNGFPFQDVLQFVFPNLLSLFSPLYSGFAALLFAGLAVWKRPSTAWFWGGVFLVALLWSFGANSGFYPLLYQVLPGLRFFRGQERAAFLIANALAILAAMGFATFIQFVLSQQKQDITRFLKVVGAVAILSATFWLFVFSDWLGNAEVYGESFTRVSFSAVIIGATWILLRVLSHPQRPLILFSSVILLLTFDVFSVTMDADSNYDSTPPTEQISMSPPAVLQSVISADETDLYRVDGYRGLTDNYGSMYQIMDMRGISPLFLTSSYTIMDGDSYNPPAWELFAVRYVFSDWQELPVPTTIVDQGVDRWGPVNVHELTSPRPFALALRQVEPVASDEEAYVQLRNPAFNLRTTLFIEDGAPSLETTTQSVDDVNIRTVSFEPESMVFEITAEEAVYISISQVDYPGWKATLDGEPTPIYRAYGGLIAMRVDAGTHTLRLAYESSTVQLGAMISLFSWVALPIMAVITIVKSRRNQNHANA